MEECFNRKIPNPNIKALINRFDNFSRFVAYSIVKLPNIKRMVK